MSNKSKWEMKSSIRSLFGSQTKLPHTFSLLLRVVLKSPATMRLWFQISTGKFMKEVHKHIFFLRSAEHVDVKDGKGHT
jgi:hypothetical protein